MRVHRVWTALRSISWLVAQQETENICSAGIPRGPRVFLKSACLYPSRSRARRALQTCHVQSAMAGAAAAAAAAAAVPWFLLHFSIDRRGV